MSGFAQHIDTEKLNQIAAQIRAIKGNMDQKIIDIDSTLKKLECDYAYKSAQSEQIKQAFESFKNLTTAEFDKDMDAFAVFIEKVSTTHTELAGVISNNITSISNQTAGIAGQFNT